MSTCSLRCSRCLAPRESSRRSSPARSLQGAFTSTRSSISLPGIAIYKNLEPNEGYGKMAENGLGLLHVYTGEGKGKTTARWAWQPGAGARPAGVRDTVHEEGRGYGEVLALRKMGIEVFQFGSETDSQGPSPPRTTWTARRALEFSAASWAAGSTTLSSWTR